LPIEHRKQPWAKKYLAVREKRLGTIEEAIGLAVLDEARPFAKIDARLWAAWPTLVGAELTTRLIPLSLHAGTLLVAVPSSSWAQQLSYLEEKLRERIAGMSEVREVKRVRFRVVPELFDAAGTGEQPSIAPTARGGPAAEPTADFAEALGAVDSLELRQAIARAAGVSVSSSKK